MSNVYLASGWFNENQLQRVTTLEKILKTKRLCVYSPRLNQQTINEEFSPQWRIEVFQSNIYHIQNADIVVAIYDEEDPGTMMEVGYAFAIGKPVVLIVFQPQAINLMLVESARAILTPRQLLYLCIESIEKIPYDGLVK